MSRTFPKVNSDEFLKTLMGQTQEEEQNYKQAADKFLTDLCKRLGIPMVVFAGGVIYERHAGHTTDADGQG